MRSFFERTDRNGNGYARWILLAMFILTPLLLWVNSSLDLENDVESWLPEDDPHAKTFAWYRELFPDEERILLSWEGSRLDDPRLEKLALRVRGTQNLQGEYPEMLPEFKAVTTPLDIGSRLVARLGVKQGDAEKKAEVLRRMQGVFLGSGEGLKVRLTGEGKQFRQELLQYTFEFAKSEWNIDLVALPAKKRSPESLPLKDDDSETHATQLQSEPGFANQSETDVDPEFQDALNYVLSSPLPEDYDFELLSPSKTLTQRQKEDLQRFLKHRNVFRGKYCTPGTFVTKEEFFLLHPIVEKSFITPGTPVAMFLTLSETGLEDRERSIQLVQQIAEEVGIPLDELHLGGRPVAGEALNVELKKVGWNEEYPWWQFHKRSPFFLSTIVGILLTLFMLRDLKLSFYVQLTSIFTMILCTALVPLTGGTMNMVLVVMPTLLMVLTVSAAIHLANYWKHAACENSEFAVSRATKMGWTPCFLASMTTSIGLASLTSSFLVPVRDFGFYSALGCLVALFIVMYCFPAMLYCSPPQCPTSLKLNRKSWRKVGETVVGWNRTITLVCLAVFIFSLCGLSFFTTETKVIRYFPEHSRVVQDYYYLERNLAGIVPVDVIVRFEQDMKDPKQRDAEGNPKPIKFLEKMEIVRRIQERIRNHPEISGSISLADFQPVNLPPNLHSDAPSLVKMREAKAYNSRNRRVEEAVKYQHSEAESFFKVATSDHPGFHSKGDELWRITSQVAIMSDLDYGDLTTELEQVVKTELAPYDNSGFVVTGMVPLFLRTQQAVLESLIVSFALAFGVIAIVMIILLKNIPAGLLTMLPNLLPVGIVFGLISWWGIRVDMGTMITASVALGIAIDGTLHFVTWFKRGLQQGLTKAESIAEAMTHCGPAMWQTSAAVGLGLLMLAFADILLISRFGWLMASLIGMALLADLLLLPALLAGPLGTLIERSMKMSGSVASHSDAPHYDPPFNDGSDGSDTPHDPDISPGGLGRQEPAPETEHQTGTAAQLPPNVTDNGYPQESRSTSQSMPPDHSESSTSIETSNDAPSQTSPEADSEIPPPHLSPFSPQRSMRDAREE